MGKLSPQATSCVLESPTVLESLTGQINELNLLIVGKLVAAPLIPCIVAIACQANCLGAWVSFWEPCLGSADQVAKWQRTDRLAK
eukprot:539114-Amphidinium_carterae.1